MTFQKTRYTAPPRNAGEYLSDEQLTDLARDLATQSSAAVPATLDAVVPRRALHLRASTSLVYRRIFRASQGEQLIGPSEEWLLDNFHLVDQTILQIENALPRRFVRQLPRLSISKGHGVPRVLAFAWLFESHSAFEFSAERLTAMIRGYQEVTPFQIGELWALPSALRFVLVEEFASLAERLDRARVMRDRANGLADRIVALKEMPGPEEFEVEVGVAACADDSFASQLLYRLRDAPERSHAAIDWLDAQLIARGSDAEEVLISDETQQSAETVLISSIIRSLRALDDLDWMTWFSSVSCVDAALGEGSNFRALDFKSRDHYRNAIETLARQSGRPELEVAETALRLFHIAAERQASAGLSVAAGTLGASRTDIGFWLVGSHRTELERELGARVPLKTRAARRYRGLGWLAVAGPVLLLTAMLVAAGLVALTLTDNSPLSVALLCAFAAIPASEAATALFNFAASLLKAPARLVGFEFVNGVPSDAATLAVVPCLLTSRDAVDDLCRRLEVHYLANPTGQVTFALASDFHDNETETASDDEDILTYARERIERLATLYAHDDRRRFYLLHRKRQFNPAEGVWMGWERKRGKLLELNQLLRGDPDTSFLPVDGVLPDDIRYVMTLDSDTRITRDAITKLVGKIAHPLNFPVFEEDSGRVVHGWSILQPRVTPSLTTGPEASVFQRVFSRDRGLDPYVFTVSDTYQDVIGEGSYTGKGLYHVDTALKLLTPALPENAILSHDLVEGTIVGCALVTDIELIEDFPTRYEVEAARQHRWARGDIQLLPLILSRSGIGPLGRWKMIDNLRRILVPAFWLAASLTGWIVLGLVSAVVLQLFLVLSLFVGPTLQLMRSGLPPSRDIVAGTHLKSLLSDVLGATVQVGLRITFIPHGALLMTDAAMRSLYRVYVSRRKLLEWKSAVAAEAACATGLYGYYRLMLWAVLIPAFGVPVLYLFAAPGLPIAVVLGGIWVFAPAVAWKVSQSAETVDSLDIAPADRLALRSVARRTWEFFDQFVTETHNWLPPDNFQETPTPVVASRTSPTNIGLSLLATISARDLGWIALPDAVGRVERTLTTVDRLEKLNGHLFNWYDTETLEPLLPRYVSTVDSGNLAGHLIALSAALRDWAGAPYVHLWTGTKGIGDVSYILCEELAAVPDDRRTIRPLRRRLEERLKGFAGALETVGPELETASVRTPLVAIAEDIDNLALGFSSEYGPPAAAVQDWARRLVAVCRDSLSDTTIGIDATEELRLRLEKASEQARRLAFSMDFRFLMQRDKRLLSIGYNPAEGKLDSSCYDLLASEARLTSLFAIAKGDLPNEHWYRLGRQLVSIGARGALMSWSGSMFEYLMPPLVIQEQTGGLLNQSNMLSVKAQIDYGHQLRVPWGISEAAYNARDREMTYQYSNFGVPLLGLKRGLASDLVIAPYASLLASQYRPAEAVSNLARLERMGARGDYGFYESVDFTPARVPEGARCAVVRTYMAHHQGMSIVAVANVVSQGLMRIRFHSDPVIEAAELLLQEKAPHEVPAIVALTEEKARMTDLAHLTGAGLREIADPAHAPRAVNMLSNGHYAVMVTATGGGSASWNGLAVTRFRPDPIEQVWGSFLFLRDIETGDWWSATPAPKPAPEEETRTVFTDSKAEFHKTVGSLRSRVDMIVASEADAQGAALTLFNDGDTDRIIEVTSYAEPVLAPARTDSAHPVFSKMFIRTEVDLEGGVIHAWRNKRGPDEPDMHIGHLVSGVGRPIEAETDRRRFIGRGRTLASAMAFDRDAPALGGGAGTSDGYTLDPVLSLRRKLRVPAGKEVRLVFWTLVAPSRAEVEAAIARYRHSGAFDRETIQAWTRSQINLHHIGVDPAEAAIFQTLAASFVLPDRSLGASGEAQRMGAQSALWGLTISGDLPIFTIRIDSEADLEVIREGLRAQEYLRSRGLLIDLVILNEHATSYAQALQAASELLCASARHRGLMAGGGEHVFALRRDLMDAAARETLIGASRAVFHARNGRLSVQLARASQMNSLEGGAPRAVQRYEARAPHPRSWQGTPVRWPSVQLGDAPEGRDLLFWNGFGGFDAARREYVIRLASGKATPSPWINVIANAGFGFQVSADGALSSWSVNSRDHQLTPWSNDPVIDRSGEAIYVIDRDTGRSFNPLPRLDTAGVARFEARHGMGYSQFRRDGGELSIVLTHHLASEDSVRVSRLVLINEGSRRLRLRITGYAEWVLGNDRARTAPFISVRADPARGMMTASNPFAIEFAGRVAFLACSAPVATFTADRTLVLGDGDVWRPNGLLLTGSLGDRTETRGDPCAAIATDLVLEPQQRAQVSFLLGDAAQADEARVLTKRLLAAERSSSGVTCAASARPWVDLLETLQIETPDPAMDLMINTWLPYQGIACRLLARSAFYQSSGAFGFRDQLQDTLAFLLHDPGLARRQILNASARQFPEGDVQHWWLPQSGAGVRTTISDDCVWLGYAVCHYIEVTGDDALLDEPLPFLTGPLLAEDAHDAFFQPETSEETVSVYEHAALAIDLALRRTGAQGLPLMMGGDWNDGMNLVGAGGRGESVWLGWLLAHVLDRLGAVARSRGDFGRAERWTAHLAMLREALEGAGWDGDWYRRAYYDDGTPLGSVNSEECRIDSIAQSWSVLSELADPDRSRRAMQNVMDQLQDREAGLIRLFTPPFVATDKVPGYIKGYPPGVRENGGQYTHAAAWVVYALAEMGQGDAAHACFSMLNPISHTLTEGAVEKYRTEPYAVAADVYSVGERRGRGGWTWYTGSAGWLYRAAVEGILGIRRAGERLSIRPVLPAAWPGYTARLRIDGSLHEIVVTRDTDGGFRVTLNGQELDESGVLQL